MAMPKVSGQRERKVIEYIKAGLTMREIAYKVGVGQAAMQRIAKENGLQFSRVKPKKLRIVREGPNYAGIAASLRWGSRLGGW